MAQHAVHHPLVAHHFDNLNQEHETNIFGMWVFLITEIMLFGGLFLAYTLYRILFPAAYHEGSSHLNVTIGGVNTAVLILSSLTVALAVRAGQVGSRRSLVFFLIVTILLGLTFLGFKAIEYREHFEAHEVPGFDWAFEGSDPVHTQMFFFLYFVMTGIHALHMVAGILVMTFVLLLGMAGRFTRGKFTGIELAGLYWHFVDVVWVFLFPLLYLIGRH